MTQEHLTISQITLRRFILGRQGLYPGRRWKGKTGTRAALEADAVIQIDPLNMIARSHEISLYGRVVNFKPADLDAVLYQDRAGFDYGGTLFVYPMHELPYFRVVMGRKANEPRRVEFAANHGEVIERMRRIVTEKGAHGSREIGGESIFKGAYRSSRDTGQALYHLWISGALMTHSRRGAERVYDLRERVAPPHFDYCASAEEADQYFALKTFRQLGIITAKSWRSSFQGSVERKVEPTEAEARLRGLIQSGMVTEIRLAEEPTIPRYLLSEDLPLLETLHRSKIPEAWQPLETTTDQEMTFLAPLEIVSARGRAKPLFGFDYIWEVYKPESQRRWGYYTLPVLYGDQLVARFDSKLDRASKSLQIKGFWTESGVQINKDFRAALKAGYARFLKFLGAERLESAVELPIDPKTVKALR